MRGEKLFSKPYGFLSALLFAGTLLLVIVGLGAEPLVLAAPAQAEGRTDALMEAIVQADLEKAGEQLYGAPSFQLADEHTNAMNSFLWDYYLSNIHFSFSGECYGVKGGLARDVVLRVPDLSAILTDLETQYNQFLEERAGELADTESAVFQRMILEEALNHILTKEPPFVNRQMTLRLVCQEGDWYVLPDDELLNLLSGIQ